ncbi:MAG: WYL domain-containing protein, partial [Campylobacterales bacterium]|nr:WYL domain-containing protein [Campylobacterales bacterium]
RLLEFPIEKDSQKRFKFIDGFTLDQTGLSNDEMILLQLSLSQFNEVTDFDKVKDKLKSKLLRKEFFNPYYIKKVDLEDIDLDSTIVEQLEFAIKERYHVKLKCVSKELIVEPYKITAYDGIWYLFAKDESDKKMKTFLLSKIKSVITMAQKHSTNPKDIDKILSKTHSAYYQDGTSFKVLIKVDPVIAHYFTQKDHLHTQKILETLEDGSLLIEFEVSHDEDIDNLIKSWLPHIEVLEPIEFKERILKELKEYILKIEAN